MIGRITGTLLVKQPPLLLVDVNGVGYEIEAPMSTFYQLPAVEQPVTLHTHLIVREDAQILCGFATEEERRLFRTLIKISGVGAKLALSILSGMSVEDFVRCVAESDSITLTRLPGVGKKTAERLLIEVKDKLKDWNLPTIEATPEGITVTTTQDPSAEAVTALIALGYKPPEASRMVMQALKDSEADLSNSEEIIRAALKAAVN